MKEFGGSCEESCAVEKATALQVICYSANITEGLARHHSLGENRSAEFDEAVGTAAHEVTTTLGDARSVSVENMRAIEQFQSQITFRNKSARSDDAYPQAELDV